MLEEIGLTYSQYTVLLVLWEQGEVSMKDMAEDLHLDSGTLSPLLKRMEANGHLVRTRSTSDERVVNVHATDAGHALRDQAAAIQSEVERTTGLNTSELVDLRNQLNSLTDHMRNQAVASV